MKRPKLPDSLTRGSERRSWQDHVGSQPHMIEAAAAENGYAPAEPFAGDVVNRIAVVDVSGILRNSEWSGWNTTAYADIVEAVNTAVADPGIDGILLRVNSPGGECTAAYETADAIVAAGKRKPVWAAIDMMAYSAGYLMASSASRIYAPPKTGGVGSIGVYCLHLDFSKMLADAGVKPTFAEDPQGKTAGHPFKPLSPAARADMQASVDYMAGLFFDHVAARRGMEPKDVRAMGAHMYDGGTAAKAAGLVDRIGTIDIALAEFRGYLDARRETNLYSAGRPANPKQEGAHMEAPNPEASAAALAPEIPNPAAATAAPVLPIPLPAAVAAGVGDAGEIVALCAIAGLSASVAHAFIQQGKTAKDVSAALIAERASAASQSEIISHVQPHSGTSAKQTGEESPLMKAATKLAQEEKERK